LRVAALEDDPARRWKIVHALFAATWGGGAGIEDRERVATALSTAGIEADPLLARAETAEGKDRLRRNTDEALARGAFGVPTLFVGGELFFGYDSFPALEAYLRGDDPAARARDVIEAWTTLAPSATRPASVRPSTS
jgi:2-hydroxychromene-2-carboxylate isomerase